MDLSHRSDRDLPSGVEKLIGSHRVITAKLVAHLAEIEERRLHLQAGFSSMFAFCIHELRFSESEAFRRIVAARLGRRFPVVHSLLASGAVHLSALELLREHLTEENHVELLEAVAGKSKCEVEALLAVRFPKPDVPARIRQLSEERFKIELTVSAELRRKLELCRDLMSHANPNRDLSVVVERAVDLLLGDLERKRLGSTKRPRREPAVVRSAKSGRIANPVRRAVFQRDGRQCTFVSPEGRRCDARTFLELDHIEPRALGGGNDTENLRVRCHAHNQLSAEQIFGRHAVERARHFRQRKCESAREKERGKPESSKGKPDLSRELEKVRLALTGMGFPDSQARRAVAEVEKLHAENDTPTLEQALREALLVATA